MTYKLTYSQEARKQIKALDKAVQLQIVKKIAHLPDDPELGKPLSNVLKNKRKLHIGKYRAIYWIEDNEITIAKVGHRKHVYD